MPSESATLARACTLCRRHGGSMRSSICRRYVTFVCVYTDVCERGLHELRCCAAPAQDKRPDITPTHSYCASMNSCDTSRTCSYRSTLHDSDHTRTSGVQNHGLTENRPRGVALLRNPGHSGGPEQNTSECYMVSPHTEKILPVSHENEAQIEAQL